MADVNPRENATPRPINERGLIVKLLLGLVLVGMAFSRIVTSCRPDPALADYNRGVAAYERKDYAAARDAFTQAVEQDDSLVAGWMNLALTELDLRHAAAAQRAAQRSIDLIDRGTGHGLPAGDAARSMKAQAYAHLSRALSQQQRRSEALAAIRAALQASPNDPKAETWKIVERELMRTQDQR